MQKLWNFLRELEWFAVFSMLFIITALVLVVLTPLWQLPVILGMAAIVSAIFSHRT